MVAVSLPNLAAVAVQIACVALLAGVVIAILRLTCPGVSYTLWRGVFILCLALPWIQTPRSPGVVSEAALAPVTRAATAPATSRGVAAGAQTDWSWLIMGTLSAGAAGRLVWLGAGLCRLRRLRRLGEPAPDEEHEALQARLGTHAEIRYAAEVRQPVTFGLRCPVVLLPASLRDHSAATRDAVLTHELVHVRRRDWASVLLEETVRACVWFHPVMWWLISRVQLAREEVVDATAVALTGRRADYLRALLAFADDVPLAPAFARRRHLFRRIALLSTEEFMSARRIVASVVAVGVAVALGSWSAIGAFPMQGGTTSSVQPQPGPVEQRATVATSGDMLPRPVRRDMPVFPPDAAGEAASATVTLRTVVDEAGNVAEVRLAGFGFRLNEFSATLNSGPGALEAFEQLLEKASFRASSGERVSAATWRPVLEAFIESAASATRQTRYEPPALGPLVFSTVVQFAAGKESVVRDMPISERLTNDGALRVGGNIRTPRKVKDVRPLYPQEARDAGVQGVVIIEMRVEADGRVGSARVLRSIPLLDQAALDAVQQWEFEPTLLNGAPIAVVMTVTVQFTAQQGG
jgi:TonB family protein